MQIYENYKGVGGLTLRCIERVASYMLSSLKEVYQKIILVRLALKLVYVYNRTEKSIS